MRWRAGDVVGAVAIGALLVIIAGCGGEESARDEYLSAVNDVDPDAFASDAAAVSYLRNVCENLRSGATPGADELDDLVVSYCDSEFAAELGIEPPPEIPDDVDLDAFRDEARERFSVGEVESDGSSIDAVAFALSFCEMTNGDLVVMKQNLGDDFAGSFQEFALSTFCPDRL